MIVFFCKLWSNANTLWKSADWKWSECSSSVIPDVGAGGNLPGVDATTLIPSWQEEPWNPYKTSNANKQKKIIRLICKIKNDEYNEQKEVRDINITVDDIRIIRSAKNIDLNLKLEE
jgi:hypothetical protein